MLERRTGRADPDECDRILFGMASVGTVFFALVCGISELVIRTYSSLEFTILCASFSLVPILVWIGTRLYWVWTGNIVPFLDSLIIFCGILLIGSLLLVPYVMFGYA